VEIVELADFEEGVTSIVSRRYKVSMFEVEGPGRLEVR
jgi:hypothetical protein